MQVQNKKIAFIGLGSYTKAPVLYTYVAEHPSVCVADAPTRFFSDAKEFAKGLAWYESHFKALVSGRKLICGELAEGYLGSPQAASLIARTYPSAKLFAIIENPLIAVRVAYVEARRAGLMERNTSLALFLKLHPEVLMRARVGKSLAQYYSYYSATDFMVIFAADIRTDILATLKSLYLHLGLNDKFVPLALRPLIPAEEVDEKKRPGLIKGLFGLLKRIIIWPYVTIKKRFQPPVVVVETVTAVARKVPLSPELEQFLKDYYRADVGELSSLLHRNLLVEWDFNSPA